MYMYMYMYMYVYMYVYVYVGIYICIYIYTYILGVRPMLGCSRIVETPIRLRVWKMGLGFKRFQACW